MVVQLTKGLGGSNKPESVDVKLIAYGYGGGFAALRPVIDKIAITFDIPSYEDQQGIKTFLIGAKEDKALLPASPANGKSNYGWRLLLPIPGSGEHLLLEAGPPTPKNEATKSAPFLRFEFNPAKLGAEGVLYLREWLRDNVLLDQYLWSDIATSGRVTRLDVAVDLLGVRTENLLVSSHVKADGGKPFKRLAYHSLAGQLETLYPHFRKGARAPFCIYDKKQELADTGFEAKYGSLSHARVEARKQPNRPITTLHKMKNPFLGLTVIDPMGKVDPPETSHAWVFFLDSCRARGVEWALSQLSAEDMRVAYKHAFQEADRNVWRAGKLWGFWPAALLQSGLLP